MGMLVRARTVRHPPAHLDRDTDALGVSAPTSR
jgi:hypothetical protein